MPAPAGSGDAITQPSVSVLAQARLYDRLAVMQVSVRRVDPAESAA
jgi:hypothetical protein